MKSKRYYTPELEAVTTFPCGRQVCNKNASGKREYLARTVEMWLRQDGNCAICGKWVDVSAAQFDHEAGRGSGGGHRNDAVFDAGGNWLNAAVCGDCNLAKASRRFTWCNGKYQEIHNSQEVTQEVA